MSNDRVYPVFLTEDEMVILRTLTELNKCTLEVTLRRAIVNEAFMQKRRKEGYTVLLNKGEDIREVLFR